MVIYRVAARLDDKNIGAADVFENLEINFTIAKAPELGLAQRHFQMATDAFCQRKIRGPRENFESVVVHDTRAPSAQFWSAHFLAQTWFQVIPICFYGDAADQPRQNRGHKSTSTSALHFTNVPVTRESLANKGLIVRKPNSGSARLRWARENSKHRRTATRQRGFCSSSVKQGPLDLTKTGVTPENGPLKIVGKTASLRAPTQSTEPPKFMVCGAFCQCQGAGFEPAVGVQCGDVNVAR